MVVVDQMEIVMISTKVKI